MKKKLTVLFLMMAMLILAAAGCSGAGGSKEDPITGSWTAARIKTAGIEIDLATFAEESGMSISAEFTFTNDGKFTGTISSGDESVPSVAGSWEAADSGYNITIQGETVAATLAEDELTMNIEGVEMVFEKNTEK